jgi:hypothetical protein
MGKIAEEAGKKVVKKFPWKKVLKLAVKLWKPIIVVALVVVIILLVLHGFGFGIGSGKGDGQGDGTVNTEMVQETTSAEEESKKVGDTYEGAIIKVNVSGNDYYYDNEKITISSLIDKLRQINGDFYVEITDENASKNAYDKLKKQLKENGIKYYEKQN